MNTKRLLGWGHLREGLSAVGEVHELSTDAQSAITDCVGRDYNIRYEI